MARSTALGFTHRDNSNGTTDSICLTCLATVATVIWEADLGLAERNHECDSLRLEHVRNFFEKPLTAKQNNATARLLPISIPRSWRPLFRQASAAD
jgi:hypothetical protein